MALTMCIYLTLIFSSSLMTDRRSKFPLKMKRNGHPMSHPDYHGVLCCPPMGWNFTAFLCLDEMPRLGGTLMSLAWWNKITLHPRLEQVRESW